MSNQSNGKYSGNRENFPILAVMIEAKFQFGATTATTRVMDTIDPDDAMVALMRHGRGDWGDVNEEDWKANNQALKDGGRLLSVYRSLERIRFWIITEADRSATTILLPEDY